MAGREETLRLRAERKELMNSRTRTEVLIPPVPMTIHCKSPGEGGLVGQLAFCGEGTIKEAYVQVELQDSKTKPIITFTTTNSAGVSLSASFPFKGTGNNIKIEREIPVDAGSVCSIYITNPENVLSVVVGVSFLPTVSKAQKESFLTATLLKETTDASTTEGGETQ